MMEAYLHEAYLWNPHGEHVNEHQYEHDGDGDDDEGDGDDDDDDYPPNDDDAGMLLSAAASCVNLVWPARYISSPDDIAIVIMTS